MPKATIKSSDPLLALGRSYHFPYPGCFQVNPVIYENNGLTHQNMLTDRLPLFNLDGKFVGFSTGGYTVDNSYDKPSKLFIRTVIPISSVTLPQQLVKAADVFKQFPQLNK